MKTTKTQVKGFGSIIRQARKESGLTLEMMGELIGKPTSAVADMERGKVIPVDMSLLTVISYHLQVDLQELLMGVIISKQFFKVPSQQGAEDYSEGLMRQQTAASATITEVDGLSLAKIEESADEFRKQAFGDGVGAVPIMDLYHSLSGMARPIVPGNPYLRIRADEFDMGDEGEGIEGVAEYIASQHMVEVRLRKDIWNLAAQGATRARFSAAHEMGHAVLHHGTLEKCEGASLFRDNAVIPSQTLQPGQKIYKNPEWQANSWASALLMPRDEVTQLIQGLGEWEDEDAAIAHHFKVSISAARVRLANLQKLAARRGLAE